MTVTRTERIDDWLAGRDVPATWTVDLTDEEMAVLGRDEDAIRKNLGRVGREELKARARAPSAR